MPFDTLETVPRDHKVPLASVSYERSARSKPRAVPRLIISIPTTLAGMCKHLRFRLEIGTGADHGKARVSGLPKGAVAYAKAAPGTMMKNALVIRFGEVPTLGEDAAAKEHCTVRKLDDNTWEIDLPAWFRPVEIPGKRKAAA